MTIKGILLAAVFVGSGSALAWSAARPWLEEPHAPNHSQPADRSSEADVPVRDAGEVFTCTPTRIWDGDGPIWCDEGPRIRLSGIAAREVKRVDGRMVDAGCRSGHPCSTRNGIEARDHLVALVGRATGTAGTGHVLVVGEPLSCESEGGGKGVRTAAWCQNKRSGDLSRAMVRDGYAVKWERYWRD